MQWVFVAMYDTSYGATCAGGFKTCATLVSSVVVYVNFFTHLYELTCPNVWLSQRVLAFYIQGYICDAIPVSSTCDCMFRQPLS